MTVLALDTSSAAASAAVVRDGLIIAECAGEEGRTQGERLPRELMRVLDVAGATLGDIDQYAVCLGPGSFTGLRVGIATVQGLAHSRGARVVPVTAFEALASSAPAGPERVAIWIDAHRGEVFATLLASDHRTGVEAPTSLTPAATLEAWAPSLSAAERVRFIGDAAVRHRDFITARLGGLAVVDATPPRLAGIVGQIACADPSRAVAPHALAPLYVRRPDAVLDRERARRATPPEH
ncbi:MAG: tRNA (adenosine(37)-N6)-threonylcarbamoyltransferase complex dimerization subunit type 1 TsaB [Vicinamibacterales bacterium]